MKKTAALLAAVLFILTAVPFSVSAEPDTYTYADALYLKELSEKGFPKSFLLPLLELHNLHPEWIFEPLLITQLNSQYTWKYVFYQESNDPATNLVDDSSGYSPYWDNKYGADFDSGWRSANDKCVRYFLDARNFLNEKDIFQFEDLSFHDTVTVEQIEEAISGTFMSKAMLENDMTYAEYIHAVGKELNVNPLHLASRIRQEQGSGTSSLISGLCGDKLWYYYENQIDEENDRMINTPESGYTEESLKRYNGLYNFFNIEAAGTGYFEIYLGGMNEAVTGTISKRAEWGSSAWDTRWKSIYGGAYKIKNKYISDYQNTLYLQKFNVDPRSSRNFWGQYMQNIGAALSEARTVYNSLAKSNCLDMAIAFSIPVYEGMPESCPDPANGSTSYAASTNKYTYVSGIGDEKLTSKAFYSEELLDANSGEIALGGWSLHKYGVSGFEYSIDGGKWEDLSSYYDDAVKSNGAGYKQALVTTYEDTVDVSGLSDGVHKIAVRARTQYGSGRGTSDCYSYLVSTTTFYRGSAPAAAVFSYNDIPDEVFADDEPESTKPRVTTKTTSKETQTTNATSSSATETPKDKDCDNTMTIILCSSAMAVIAIIIAVLFIKKRKQKSMEEN